jgi:hypothetical protein
MWSDTGSYIFASPGDITQSINLEGFNLEGPIKGSRQLEASAMRKKLLFRPNSYK